MRLLKLHMRWPERQAMAGLSEEGIAFYNWLIETRANDPLVRGIGGPEDVERFLNLNRGVIQKSYVSQQDLREEDRIERKLRVLISQYNQQSKVFEGSHRGETVNLGMRGIRFSVPAPIGGDRILRLTVTPVGFPIRIFNLLADPCWIAEVDSHYHIGVRLRRIEDFETWSREFDDRFRN